MIERFERKKNNDISQSFDRISTEGTFNNRNQYSEPKISQEPPKRKSFRIQPKSMFEPFDHEKIDCSQKKTEIIEA